LIYFKNDHFLFKKLDKPIFHKSLLDFFVQFLGTTFENTLLTDDTPHKNLFNPLLVPFLKMFYRLHNDINYLLQTIFLFLESLHSFGMRVYKFVQFNPFGSTIDVLLDDL
jgi:hypothetical protein